METDPNKPAEEHQRAMTPFFAALPVDLQVAVLQTWIADPDHESILLRGLSALDVPCSNRSLRLPLQTLLAHPGIVWPECDAGAQHRNVKADVEPSDTAGFMHWLHSRRVGVRWLCVSGWKPSTSAALKNMPSLSLPFVTALVIAEAVPDGSLLPDLLTACPSLTHIRSLTLLNRRDLSDGDWAIISTLQLQSFVVRSYARVSVKRLIAVLQSSGNTLKELRISGMSYKSKLFQAIIAHCKLVEVLEVDIDAVAFGAFVSLLRGPAHLQELSLKSCKIDDLGIVSNACPVCLKRIFITEIVLDDGEQAGAGVKYAVFVRILEGHGQLEFVKVADNSYDRNSSNLVLSAPHDSMEQVALLKRIMALCLPVQQLTVTLQDITSEGIEHGGLLHVRDIVPLLKDLQNLTITCSHAEQCIAVLRACLSLTTLSIKVPNNTLDAIFRSLPASCTHHLQELCIGDEIVCTEDALEMVLIKCPLLEVMKLEATDESCVRFNLCTLPKLLLETMTCHKTPLKLFLYSWQLSLSAAVTPSDLEGFRALARERQLIPVPCFQVEPKPAWRSYNPFDTLFICGVFW